MKKMKKSEIIIIIILLLVIIIAPFFPLFKKEELNEKNSIDISVMILKNENRFITIDSIVNTFVSNVKYRNIEALMSILYKMYIEEEKINNSNVLDVLETYDELYISDVREVYQIKEFNNIYVYYVKAKLVEEEFDSFYQTFIKTVYYRVTINENTLTFAIAPIDGDEYMDKVGDQNG